MQNYQNLTKKQPFLHQAKIAVWMRHLNNNIFYIFNLRYVTVYVRQISLQQTLCVSKISKTNGFVQPYEYLHFRNWLMN